MSCLPNVVWYGRCRTRGSGSYSGWEWERDLEWAIGGDVLSGKAWRTPPLLSTGRRRGLLTRCYAVAAAPAACNGGLKVCALARG